MDDGIRRQREDAMPTNDTTLIEEPPSLEAAARRLAPWGFLADPDLPDRPGPAGSGWAELRYWLNRAAAPPRPPRCGGPLRSARS